MATKIQFKESYHHRDARASFPYLCRRYMNSFTKASSLSEQVTIRLSSELPVVIEYNKIAEMGYIRFYLAPKIEEDEKR